MSITDNQLLLVLAVHNLPKLGPARLRQVVPELKNREAGDGLKEFTDLTKRLQRDFNLPELSTTNVVSAWEKAGRQLEKTRKLNMQVLVYGWRSYPPRVARLVDAPTLLFVRGEFQPEAPAVAVVGTRKNSEWGATTARACASKLAEQGIVVVSGLALGIDSIAQRATVERGGKTWAVLAHGLHTVSPSSNRDLAEKIIDTGGALISEYPPGVHAQRSYFVERDRIQGALSQAILVIETGPDGGSMHTVRFGKQLGVPIWVTFPHQMCPVAEMKESSLPEQQRGTWLLLKEGALRVSCASDIDVLTETLRLTAADEKETDKESVPPVTHPRLF